MSNFGPDPHAFFAAVYQAEAPWDIGAPQPALLELLAEVPPEGPILDVGCGSGDLGIALAQRGVEVLGVDFVEAAISQARAKAESLSAEPRPLPGLSPAAPLVSPQPGAPPCRRELRPVPTK
jgi:SAM-dependent methyltransferase